MHQKTRQGLKQDCRQIIVGSLEVAMHQKTRQGLKLNMILPRQLDNSSRNAPENPPGIETHRTGTGLQPGIKSQCTRKPARD